LTDLSPFDKPFDAFLFDMDGTVLSSIAATERVWGQWAIRHGIDPVTFVPTIHGVRAVDTVRRLGLPHLDPDTEAKILLDAEMADLDGIVAIEGVLDFLNSLPEDRWAIVTSAPIELARRRLQAAGLPMPKQSSPLKMFSAESQALNASSWAQSGLASIRTIVLCLKMRLRALLPAKLLAHASLL